MKLFINAGICERKWNGNVKIKELSSFRLKLSIPNYVESEKKQEYIKIILPEDIKEKDLEEDLLLEGVFLKKTSKNTYHVDYLTKPSKDLMYALLRSTDVIPDDIFIPASMKDRVRVLRRIRFIDDEVDYGDFLSNVYLIEIDLNIGERLPVYLTENEPKILEKRYEFYKSSWDRQYYVSQKIKTIILLNECNKDEYISLASLCE